MDGNTRTLRSLHLAGGRSGALTSKGWMALEPYLLEPMVIGLLPYRVNKRDDKGIGGYLVYQATVSPWVATASGHNPAGWPTLLTFDLSSGRVTR